MLEDTFLAREPVFTLGELVGHLAGSEPLEPVRPDLAAPRLLARWEREGRVVRIRPDLYAAVRAGRDAERLQPWPFLVGTKLAPDAVVSHHSALDFWGISYSMWFEVVYSASRPPPRTSYGAMLYRGVRFHERLIESGQQHFGVAEERYAGGMARVTTIERTLVDLLASPDLGGSWEEIWRSMARADNIDVATVAAYCEVLGADAALRTKVGFFLDQHRDQWGVGDPDLAPFRPSPAHEPHRLDPTGSRACRLVQDWNLTVPIQLLERSWAAFH